eukprot:2752094-Amphidinium_carterae.1
MQKRTKAGESTEVIQLPLNSLASHNSTAKPSGLAPMSTCTQASCMDLYQSSHTHFCDVWTAPHPQLVVEVIVPLRCF